MRFFITASLGKRHNIIEALFFLKAEKSVSNHESNYDLFIAEFPFRKLLGLLRYRFCCCCHPTLKISVNSQQLYFYKVNKQTKPEKSPVEIMDQQKQIQDKRGCK